MIAFFPPAIRLSYFAFLALALGTQAFAAEAGNIGVGGLIGLGFYQAGTSGTFGIQFYYNLNSAFSLGLSNTYSSLYSGPSSSGSNSITVSAAHYDADIDYHFAKYPFWVGTRLGIWVLNSNAPLSADVASTIEGVPFSQAASLVGFEWGPAVGYDYALYEHLLIGLDFSFLISSIQGVSVSAIQTLASVKFQF